MPSARTKVRWNCRARSRGADIRGSRNRPAAAADREFFLLDRDLERVTGEPCNRKRDPQPLGLAVRPRQPFDVVGRVTVRRLRNPVERPLDLVEAEQERARKGLNARHDAKPSFQATLWMGPDSAPKAGNDRRLRLFPYGTGQRHSSSGKAPQFQAATGDSGDLVEPGGVEPPTSCMPCKRSPN